METIFHLKIQSGPEIGKEIPLEKPEITLGRDPNSDITISDPEVSRHHARLLRTGQQYSIEDLGSTNGTFVQGNQIHGINPLNSNDVITIGERVVLVFEAMEFDPDATMAVPRRVEVPAEEPPVEAQQSPVSQAALSESGSVPPLQPQVSAPPLKPVTSVSGVPQSSLKIEEADLLPASTYVGKTPEQPATARKRSSWRGIVLIIVLLILIFCVIPWIIIDVTNSYCLFLPGILNAIQSGVCP